MADDIGEAGFDQVRFGGNPRANGDALKDAVVLLMELPDKSRLDIRSLDDRVLGELATACAGTSVTCRREASSPDALAVALETATLTVADDQPCGLRDFIFAAVLIRVHRAAGAPTDYRLDNLIDDARLTVVDELPQVLGYSSVAEMATGASGPGGHLEIDQEAAASGVHEIHFQVA